MGRPHAFDACTLHDDASDACRAAATETRAQYTPVQPRDSVPDYNDARHAAMCVLDDEIPSLCVIELEALGRFAVLLTTSRTTAAALAKMLLAEVSE